MEKDFDWLKPSIPWAFIGVMILGIAILMGGAWAYESLSFEDSGLGILLKMQFLYHGFVLLQLPTYYSLLVKKKSFI